jgi:carbon-monoxide dehydrogenase medium subunit
MNEIFKYRAPKTRDELLGLLADHGEGAKVLAGGTDLLVDMRSGLLHPEMVINLKRVDDFPSLAWSASEGLVIGPATTVNEVVFDARVRNSYPLLADCALTLASHQLRNRATVVGNIAHASPGADMAPGLLCLGAHVLIASRRAQREMPLKDFFTGVKRTALQPDEIIEAIVVPPGTAGARGSYRKLKRIEGHDLSLVGVAVTKNDGALRVAIGSVAPTPLLVDGLSESDSADAVVAAVRGVIRPIDDLRCSKEYREYMVEVYVRRLLEEVA